MQDARTTVRMPKIDAPRRAKSHARPEPPEAAADVTAASAEPRMTRVEARAAAKAGESQARGARGSHADAADDDGGYDRRQARAERRAERRRGVGLMLTGGFAGIAVGGFLLFGTAGGGGGSTPAGSAVAETSTSGAEGLTATISASAGHSVGATSIIRVPIASASKSPSKSPSASPTKSATPGSTTSSPASSTSAPVSSSSAPPTTTSAPTSSSPAPTKTTTWCFLIC